MKRLDKDIDIDQVCSMVRRVGLMRAAIDVMCESFLIRAKDTDDDPLWKRFFEIQMCSYIEAKKSMDICAPEGDMLHDLIRDTWLDVRAYMEEGKFGPVKNVEQWFRTIRIDFPVDTEGPSGTGFAGLTTECFTVVGQNDPKLPEFELTV